MSTWQDAGGQSFVALDEREPEPVAPEGELPCPWRVTRLWGDGPPLWVIYRLGEPGPRLTFTDEVHGDLAQLTSAALAVAERPRPVSATSKAAMAASA